jgi:hypothetical protein
MTIYQYSATGNIFANTSESISNRIFTYSDPTIIQYSQEDFGSTSNEIISSENYGDFFSITESDDYESILTFETLIPFGTYTFSGSLIEKETDSYVGLGTLAFSGSLVEKNTESYVGVGNIKLGLGKIYVGDNENEFSSDQITFDSIQETFDDDLLILPSALESFSAQTPEDTVLYTFSGSLIESRTYNYNELISPITNLLDYGDITEVSGELEDDFGEISQSPGLIVDFAFIVNEVEDNLLPFGKVTLSGSALYQPNYRLYIDGTALIKATYSDDVGAGTLAFSGSALEAYSAQTPEDTQLFSISGSLIEKETDSYVGLGTLAFSGSLIEKETDSYVGAGTLAFSGSALEAYSAQIPEDTVLYTFSGSALEVYSAQTPEDLVLYTFSGSALEVYSAQTPEDLVLYTFSNTPLVHPFVDYTPHYGIEKNIGIGTVGVQIFGTLIENNTGSYVGTGNLFGFGTKLESVTYDYNETSEGDPFEDYGLITDNFEFFQDYQSITSGGSVTDFGLIIDPLLVANTPFGSLTFSGSALEAYSAQTPEDLVLYTFSGSSVDREIQVYGVDYVTSGILSFSNTPLVHPFVDYTPHYGIEKNIGIGTVGIQIFGSALEAYSAQTPEDTQLFSISGSALEAYSAQTPEDLVLYTFSGSLVEKNTESYVGAGTLAFSGSALEAYSAQTPEDTQLFSISGSALEAYSAQTPEDLVLYTFSGSLVEKNTESYVGVGTLTFSQSAVEENTESYAGAGTLAFSGSALEAYSAQTPEDTQLFSISGQAPTNRNREFISQTLTLTLSNTPLVHPFVDYTPHYGIEKNIGIGTFGIRFVSGVGFTPDSEGNLRDARTYSNVYPGNDKVPGTGIGTFKFDETNNTAKYSPLTPYTGRGLISLSGIGLESFSITNYDGSGLISISGISSNRPISVYQGYITSGTITISQQTQPIIEKNTESYVGIGNIIKFGTLSDERIVNDYTASGTINLGKTTPTGVICSDSEQFGSSTTTFDSTLETFDVLCDSPQVIFSSALDSFSAQTPEDTVLYTFSGSALESYSAQTPEDTVLYEFAESLIERITKSYSGEGAISFSGNANESIGTNPPATGNIRFTTHLSDNLYDTCDSIDITSDYQNSAFVSFIANPPESTQLFSILGSASTNEINVYEYIGVENLTFSGSLVERETDSYAGIGTLFTLLGGSELDVNSYRGSGSLFAISGSSDSKSSQIPEDTILITISGAASTKLEFEYSYSGIGTEYITGSAITSIEPDYLYFGTGVVTLTGELVYPDIQFIPTPKGFGLFTLSGISSNSISRIGVLSGNKTLFAFSGAFESFSESTYIGLGTIYTESIVGIAISNPFQIPRTYIIII